MTGPLDTDRQPLTGTEDRPIERIPDEPGMRLDWLALLAGPIIWISHFMVVYLAGETACTPTDEDQWSFFDGDTVAVLTVVATVAALAACIGAALFARRRMHRHDPHGDANYVFDFARTGFLMAVAAGIGVLTVGAPALYLSPLC